jgi:ABC-2 type transport system ATP-binding protein
MIHVENLTKYYQDLCAVDQVSFDIPKGEILGLLGPNGAGKTSILRMLTGYLRPTAGDIHIKDYTIDRDPLEIKKLMGYLPESAPLYRDMITFDYLQFIADIRGMDLERKGSRIRELSSLCGLDEVMHKTIGELSKGYKQRVGLAHAMMDDPEILVLDEPTSGLDPNQIIEIRDIIRRIGREKTVILSTHILNEAEATCDRVMIIHRGKIVADDTTETLRKSMEGESLIRLSFQGADIPSIKRTLGPIEGIAEMQFGEGEEGFLKVTLVCRSSADLRGQIYERIKATDWVLLEFLREIQSLESIFHELTKEN